MREESPGDAAQTQMLLGDSETRHARPRQRHVSIGDEPLDLNVQPQ
jgi:hypothetical protein